MEVNSEKFYSKFPHAFLQTYVNLGKRA